MRDVQKVGLERTRREALDLLMSVGPLIDRRLFGDLAWLAFRGLRPGDPRFAEEWNFAVNTQYLREAGFIERDEPEAREAAEPASENPAGAGEEAGTLAHHPRVISLATCRSRATTSSRSVRGNRMLMLSGRSWPSFRATPAR